MFTKKMAILISMILGIVLFSNQSFANSNVMLPQIDTTDIFVLNESTVVLLDRVSNKVDLVDVKTNNSINLSSDSNPILDLGVIKNPEKFILLKKISPTKITKSVFSFKGNLLSKTEIPMKDTGDKLKWVAPTGKVNERIMVQTKNVFNLYEYPWKKPTVTYNAQVVDKGYESVSVMDWDFEKYPNLAIKYVGQGIGIDDYFLKTINLYTKKESFFKDFNTDFQFKFLGNKLSIFNSYTYQSVLASANRPKPTDSQVFYRIINVSTNNKIKSLQSFFNEDKDKESGWVTVFNNSQLFVGDLAKQTWSLYSSTGESILKNQKWAMGSKFISYNSNLKVAYFLEYKDGKTIISSYPASVK
jgi:hypothetical protein